MIRPNDPHQFEPSWKQVADFLARAEERYKIVRKQLAGNLGVSKAALSGWSTDNAQAKISLDKLRPFARETRMTQDELVVLTFTRLCEMDGSKLQLNVDLLADAISYLLPTREEQRVLDVYNEVFAEITFSVFDQPSYRKRLMGALRTIAADAVAEHIAEGQAE